jgi:alpha-beta hydrolase superfamily lysophospholipase
VGRLRLHYSTWEVERPRGALMVVHGLFEHAGRYAELGQHMAGHGYSTFALDLRGHGASEGRRGHVRRFGVLLQDLDRFRREVQGLVPVNLPVFLLAHSMGGLIAIRYLEEFEFPFGGAVISSPWLATAVPVPGWQQLAIRMLDRILPAAPLPVRLDPNDLTHDDERAADYRDDPKVHATMTPRLFMETRLAMEEAARRADRISVPILFLLAGADRIVDTDRSLEFARSLPAEDVTIEVLENAYHEVLQERDRAAVLARIADWIGSRSS